MSLALLALKLLFLLINTNKTPRKSMFWYKRRNATPHFAAFSANQLLGPVIVSWENGCVTVYLVGTQILNESDIAKEIGKLFFFHPLFRSFTYNTYTYKYIRIRIYYICF